MFLALDCETGGLDPEKTDLLTLYMAIVDEDFKILEEIDLKLKPNEGGIPMAESSALDTNKININEHILDPKTITYLEAKQKIVIMLKKYLKKTGGYSNLRPLGHNVLFDINYINKYILPIEEWNSLIHYRIADTSQIVSFLKDVGWFPQNLGNLASVVDYLNVPTRPAHEAKNDTLMCIDVYKSILSIMKSKKDNVNSMASQDLIGLLESE